MLEGTVRFTLSSKDIKTYPYSDEVVEISLDLNKDNPKILIENFSGDAIEIDLRYAKKLAKIFQTIAAISRAND